MEKTYGFVGSGRVTRLILEGFKRGKGWPKKAFVSDANGETLKKLQDHFSDKAVSPCDNKQAASSDVVFLALHPPAIKDCLEEIKASLKPDAVFISLAPKLSLSALSKNLGGFDRIVRMIPNAPSFVNAGYNPISFSGAFTREEKKELSSMLGVLGECPEVEESKLEAYAIITAMGPTYFWFQIEELQKISEAFGLSANETGDGIAKMLHGAVKTYFDSGLTASEVMDLVPVKPLGEVEGSIREAYGTKLRELYQKLKS